MDTYEGTTKLNETGDAGLGVAVMVNCAVFDGPPVTTVSELGVAVIEPDQEQGCVETNKQHNRAQSNGNKYTKTINKPGGTTCTVNEGIDSWLYAGSADAVGENVIVAGVPCVVPVCCCVSCVNRVKDKPVTVIET